MSNIGWLRQLADQQHFGALKQAIFELVGAGLEAADPDFLPLLSVACFHLGDTEVALEALQLAVSREAGLSLDGRVDLAAARIFTGEVELACLQLENVLAQQPDHSLALVRLGFCYWRRGYTDRALDCYQRSVLLKPERIAASLSLASLYIAQHQEKAAQSVLNDAVDQLNTQCRVLSDDVVQRLMAQLRALQLEVWLAAGELERAEAWLQERQTDIAETDWLPLVAGFAQLLAGRNRYAEAELQLQRGLEAYPKALALRSQLAELVQVQGRHRQAVQLLRQAIRMAGKESLPQAGLWLQLGRACLHMAPEQARRAADKALELAASEDETLLLVVDDPEGGRKAPLWWQARNLQAMVEAHDENFDLSESLFQEVLAAHPMMVPALQGLGQQYLQLGRVDDAVALFERVRDIDPASGYAALINARRFPEDEETLHRLEKLASRPGVEGQVRSGLLFQLAAAWEKRKDYDKAFVLASQANEASRQHLKYDPAAHRQQCARIRHAFPKALFEHRKQCGVDSRLPVFVLGMPRSGTTLVEQILASHSQIFGAGELGVIPQRIQGLNRWERHVGSGRQYPDCVDDLTPYVVEGIANGILKELRELAADDKPEALHVVDKLPHNFENVGLIKFLFPQARIISVRRDPRDIAMSNYFIDYQAKHGGMGFAYDLTWIGEQLADHNLLMHHWSQVFPDQILEVHYEQLLADPEGQARRMLRYIGVDWEPQVLNFTELDRAVKTASVWQVRQPIYQTSKAKWKRYESHLGPLIKGTNARIEWAPVEMITLPQSGFLTDGVALYREEKLDEAELSFKKMLHHNPDHRACQYMLGLIYCRKGHLDEGIALMQIAVDKAPWQRDWKENLALALERNGDAEAAAAVRARLARRGTVASVEEDQHPDDQEAFGLMMESELQYPGLGNS